jgi:hypothetical protein
MADGLGAAGRHLSTDRHMVGLAPNSFDDGDDDGGMLGLHSG